MTALETAVYQQVPTDDAEAQMLASADLDDMKSKGDVCQVTSILRLKPRWMALNKRTVAMVIEP